MKRGTPLKRSTPLRADPVATRAFVQRGRGKLKAATAPTDFRDDDGRPSLTGVWDRQTWPTSAPKGGRVPLSARKEAMARTRGRCLMCSAKAVQVHHVLPRNKWPHLAKLAANLVGMCVGCHDNHERAHRRIPRALLPAETVALAEAEGLGWYIERTYPA